MSIQVYNFSAVQANETIGQRTFTFQRNGAAMDLTNVEIAAHFVLGGTTVNKTEGSGITVTDAANGEFQLDAFTLPTAGTWRYELELTFTDTSTVVTYLTGVIEVL